MSLYNNIVSRTPLDKGWSGDKKYRVTADGGKYLLRISPIEKYEAKKDEYELTRLIDALGIPMCRPVEFGICEEGVYCLQSWIDGEDADAVIPQMSEREQYALGRQAGEILRKVHSLAAPQGLESWRLRFGGKAERELESYRACGLRFEGDGELAAYLKNNLALLDSRPQMMLHGDYGLSNLMCAGGRIYAIDFCPFYGDPWQDFEAIRWMVDGSRRFAVGTVDGYFDDVVPPQFWQLLKLYLCEGCFHNIVWSVNTRDKGQIGTTLRQIKEVQGWFDNMTKPVPTWYIGGKYE